MEKVYKDVNCNYFLLTILAVLIPIAVSIYHPLLFGIISILVSFILLLKKNFFLVGIPLLIVFQLYIPWVGLTGTLAVIVLFLFGLFFISKDIKTLKHPAILLYLIYLGSLFISVLYAVDKSFGLKFTFLVVIGLIGIIVGIGIKQNNEVNYELVLKGLVVTSLSLSIVNILFFLFPEMEVNFLRSEFAKWVINPSSVEALFRESRNNILDPDKAGTVFLNTNVGAVFFNILTWISLSLFLSNKQPLYLVIAILHSAAMLSTNSRAGVLAFSLSSLIIFLILSMKNKKTISYFFFGIPLFFTTLITVLLIGNFNNIVGRLSLTALENDPRIYLWKSLPKIVDNGLLGLGFGGWELFHNLPAHNIAIITWLQSGILGVSTLTIFMLFVLKYGFLQMKENKYAISLVGSTLCVLIQGMFDNYFLNDIRVSLVFFLLVGFFAHYKSKKTG